MELYRPLSLLVVLAALGGCLAAPGPAGEPTADTATATPTPTDTGTVPPGETPLPDSPTPGEPNHGETVDYADLPPESRAAFDDTLDGTVSFVPDTQYVDGEHTVDAAKPFHDYEYVRKNGTQYAIDLSMDGKLYVSYGIDSEPVGKDVNATAVRVSSLSTDVRDEVRWAVENGSHTVPAGKWDSLPGELGDAEYVRYRGKTYDMSYMYGDYWALRLSVERGD
ncbi:hypothetical protein [Halosimplex sp. J119]